MKKEHRFIIGAAAALLLFVGGGCAGREKARIEADVPAATGQPAPTGPEAEVDATVDAILMGGDEEAAEQKKVEDEAAEVGSDSMELNAYGESSYEVK